MIIFKIFFDFIIAIIATLFVIMIAIALINIPHLIFGGFFKRKKENKISLPDSVQITYLKNEHGETSQHKTIKF